MKIHGWSFTRFLALLLVLELGLASSMPAQASLLRGHVPLAAAPQPVSIFPASFDNLVNQPVTIAGTSLEGVTSAALGTTALIDLEVTSTAIHARVPWNIAPGTYNLQLTDQAGGSAMLNNAVTITPGNPSWASNGPYGGVLRNVVVDQVHPEHVYAAGVYSGLFRSQNGGANWGLAYLAASDTVKMIYPSSVLPPVIYTHAGSNSIVRSTDYGLTWEEKTIPDVELYYYLKTHVFVRPGHPDSLYLSVYDKEDLNDPLGGLYESTNRGDTWKMMDGTSGRQVSGVAFDPGNDLNIVIATINGQVLTSGDGGANWSDPITVAFQDTWYQDIWLDFSPTQFGDKRSLWLIPCNSILEGWHPCSNTDGNQIENTAYRSIDGGQTWVPIMVAERVTVQSFAFSDTIPGLMWAAAGDGFYSMDGGDTWNPVGAGLHNVFGFAAGPGAVSQEKTTLFAATQRGLFKSTDGGAAWQESDTGLGAVLGEAIAISPFNADEAYVATRGGSKGLQYTEDGGRSWETLPVPVGDESPLLATDPFVDGKLYFSYPHWDGGPPRIGVSKDHGKTYSEYSVVFPPESANQGGYIATIEPDPRRPGRILAGLCETGDPGGQGYGLGYIYASTDGGVTWEQQTTPPGITCVSSIAFDPHWNSACGIDPDTDPEEPEVVYAISERSGVLRSTDAGAIWTLLAHKPPNPQLKFIVIDPMDSATLFVSARGGLPTDPSGVYVSHDGGETWPDLMPPAWAMRFVLQKDKAWWLYAGWVDGLQILRKVWMDPANGWEAAPGIAGKAAITGFNVATECDGEKPVRVVHYLGMVGGLRSQTLPGGSPPARQMGNTLDDSPYYPGGIYRSVSPIDSQPTVPGWELKGISGAGTVITAMEVFNGQLYTGATNWGTGARVWRLSTDTGWSPASALGMSPTYGATNGAIPDMAVFKDHLYAAVGWGSNEGQIWRTGNGTDWEKVTDQEFGGSTSYTPSVMAVFQDQLYAFAIGSNTPVQIWRSSTGDSGSWEHLLPDGFGNAHNGSVPGAAVLNGTLYAVTGNSTDGVEVWRTSSGTQWEQINISGYGAADNLDASGMTVFKGALYVGVANASTGGQLWRYNGTSWSKAAQDGFGDTHNQSIDGLYGTRNQLYVVTHNQTCGLQVWTSMDGTHWSPSNLDGFGNPQNQSTFWSNAVTMLGNQFFVGTWDGGNGGEVWAHSEIFFPVFIPAVRR